jgi:hypothetical protein
MLGLPVFAGPFIDTKLHYYSKRAPQQCQARCEMVQGHLRRYVRRPGLRTEANLQMRG